MTDKRSRIRVTRDGRCLTLRLDRPERRNAIDGAMLDALDAALDAAAADREIVSVILGGSEAAFCAGADLKEGLPDPLVRVERMHRLVLRFTELPVLTIAAIDGFALGGGLELALACDLRIASPSARLGFPEIGMGVFPAYGGTQLLPHLTGMSTAVRMILGGEPIGPEEATRLGLIDEVADGPAMPAARAHVARYEARSPAAIGAALQAIRAGKRAHLEAGLPAERAALIQLKRGHA